MEILHRAIFCANGVHESMTCKLSNGAAISLSLFPGYQLQILNLSLSFSAIKS